MDSRVQFVIDHMQADLRHPPSPSEMAKRVNVSASRLRHLFKAETGVTQAQYLNLLRLKRAKKLLETTFMNVRQVMADVGVNDRSHFVRNFRRTFGATPTEFRSRHRKGLSSQHAVADTATK